jgi:hypothetical protein
LSFDDYFQIRQTVSATPNEDDVTDSEISQYAYVLFNKDILKVATFDVHKEGQINAIFLHSLGAEFERRGGSNRAER